MDDQSMSPLPIKVVEQKEEIINSQSSTLSPQKVIKIQEEITMTFPKVMEAIINGKKITRLEWGTKAIYGLLDGGILKLRKDDGKFYHWILSEGDIFGNDWYVI